MLLVLQESPLSRGMSFRALNHGSRETANSPRLPEAYTHAFPITYNIFTLYVAFENKPAMATVRPGILSPFPAVRLVVKNISMVLNFRTQFYHNIYYREELL